jgi:hypothetical protein
MDTLWTATAIRQEGNLNSKRLRAYKALNKTTVQALAPKYTKSLKTFIYLLQSLIILREILTPSITVIILLESS